MLDLLQHWAYFRVSEDLGSDARQDEIVLLICITKWDVSKLNHHMLLILTLGCQKTEWMSNGPMVISHTVGTKGHMITGWPFDSPILTCHNTSGMTKWSLQHNSTLLGNYRKSHKWWLANSTVHAQTGTVCASQTAVHRKDKTSYLCFYALRERKCRSHGYNLHRVECLAVHEISCSIHVSQYNWMSVLIVWLQFSKMSKY